MEEIICYVQSVVEFVRIRGFGAIGEVVSYLFGCILQQLSECSCFWLVERTTSTVEDLWFFSKVFSSSSRFLTVASRTGTETAGPADWPVAWSKNCTRTLPRLSGIGSTSCCTLVRLANAVRRRLLGGGRVVAIKIQDQ